MTECSGSSQGSTRGPLAEPQDPAGLSGRAHEASTELDDARSPRGAPPLMVAEPQRIAVLRLGYAGARREPTPAVRSTDLQRRARATPRSSPTAWAGRLPAQVSLCNDRHPLTHVQVKFNESNSTVMTPFAFSVK
jgi:hypothetical protein